MYSVSYEGLEKLKSDVARLNKKSGNNISISIISESIEKIDKVDYKFYDVDIKESRQYLGDWELIAVKKNVGSILCFQLAVIPFRLHSEITISAVSIATLSGHVNKWY